ncbi:hypothetical protein B0H19DRAFT_1290680 [Mycena capillaripes]|nr:hypothetical protein B0H19DRAFT_1290680 [Mycena capillaripes]
MTLHHYSTAIQAWRQEKGWQGLDERQIELDPEEQEGGSTPLREGSPDTVVGEENDMGGGKKIYQPFDPQVRYLCGGSLVSAQNGLWLFCGVTIICIPFTFLIPETKDRDADVIDLEERRAAAGYRRSRLA